MITYSMYARKRITGGVVNIVAGVPDFNLLNNILNSLGGPSVYIDSFYITQKQGDVEEVVAIKEKELPSSNTKCKSR